MRKRIISAMVLVLILATMLPVMGASALIGPQYVSTANGKGLYMREGPSKNAGIILTIPFGACVDSYEYYNDTWGYVSYNGEYGYCMRRYFSSTKPTHKPDPQPTSAPSTNLYSNFYKTNYYVTVRPSTPTSSVNLRWAPSKKQAIQTTYYAGYQLHVIAQNDTWAQVIDEDGNISGFMMLAFLSETAVGSRAN